jgi:hypothetical protein
MDKPVAPGGALMTAVEVMQRLGCSEAKLVTCREHLGAVRCGDDWLFVEDAVAEFAERFWRQA